jgi:hypothetical protein
MAQRGRAENAGEKFIVHPVALLPWAISPAAFVEPAVTELPVPHEPDAIVGIVPENDIVLPRLTPPAKFPDPVE